MCMPSLNEICESILSFRALKLELVHKYALLEKNDTGICLERTDPNTVTMFSLSPSGSIRETNMVDEVNETLQKIMLNICINKENNVKN